MKELLKEALDTAFKKMTVPQKKIVTNRKHISGFPSVAEVLVAAGEIKESTGLSFDEISITTSDECAVFESNEIYATWETKEDKTEKEILKEKKKKFTGFAYKFIYNILVKENGYKKLGYSTAHLKKFDDTTIYDLYVANDYDRLEEYYSLSLKKDL